MNKISINDLIINNSLSEDSFILNNLFFLPKNLPIQQYHLNILKKWEISEIFSNGNILNKGMNKIIQAEVKPEDTLTKEDAQAQSSGLLDASVKGFSETYARWIKKTIMIFSDILNKKPVDKEMIKNFIIDIIYTVNKNRNNALMLFGKSFEGVLYIYPKTLETVILAFIIGESLKQSQLTISNLAIAALFHDLGMLRIPKSILEKKEALTEDEKTIIRNHTNIGYKYLREINYSAIVASGALQHHERLDGKGYPNRLTGDKITEIAKIISVVDSYCAAIANKPFIEPTHAKEVLQELLRSGGTAYEPSIIKELIKNISFYPIGSLVLLSNDIPARVMGTSGVPMKPIVKKMTANPGEEDILDLSKSENIYIKGLYIKKTENEKTS